MKLSVTPIYGWGWHMWSDTSALDVPAPFLLEAETVAGRADVFLGHLQQQEHPLNSLWLLLSFRSSYTHDLRTYDCYNLRAFRTRPTILDWLQPLEDAPLLTGYVQVPKHP